MFVSTEFGNVEHTPSRLRMNAFHVVSARCRSKQANKDNLPMKVDQKVLEHCRLKSIGIFHRKKRYSKDVCLCHRAAQYILVAGKNVSRTLKIRRTMIMLKSFQESNHIMLSLGG